MNSANLFMPHGHCILWKPGILFPMVVSDVLIFIAYSLIPITIFYFVRNRTDLDSKAKNLAWLFFAFIQLCGFTHLLTAWNFWHSEYELQVALKMTTAMVSIVTAIICLKLRKLLVKLPSMSAFEKINNELKILNDELESKVMSRTAELESAKRYAESIVATIDDGVVENFPVKNDAGEIIDFGMKDLNGKPGEYYSLMGNDAFNTQSMLETFPQTKNSGYFDNVVKCYQSGENVYEEKFFDETVDRYYRYTLIPMKEHDSVLSFFNDITESVEQSIELFNSSKLAALGEMSGGLAHEINTPLQVMSMLSRKLKRDVGEENKSLKILDDHILRLMDITTNLRKLSRSDSDKVVPMNLKSITNDTLKLIQEKVDRHDVKIERRFDGREDFNVYLSPISFSQILMNLLSNSIYELSKCEEKTIIIDFAENGNKIQLIVSDTAGKIDEAIAGKIFNPLFTTKPEGEGTGLGLSLSLRLAKNMQGNLFLDQLNEKKFILEMRASE